MHTVVLQCCVKVGFQPFPVDMLASLPEAQESVIDNLLCVGFVVHESQRENAVATAVAVKGFRKLLKYMGIRLNHGYWAIGGKRACIGPSKQSKAGTSSWAW